VGPGVPGVRPGDAVCGSTLLHLRRQGAHAGFIPVAAGRVHVIPNGVSFEEAASLPGAALTALNGLRLCGDVAGRSVRINGATGGVRGKIVLRMEGREQ